VGVQIRVAPRTPRYPGLGRAFRPPRQANNAPVRARAWRAGRDLLPYRRARRWWPRSSRCTKTALRSGKVPPEGSRRGGSHPAGLSVIRTRGTRRVARAFEGSVARAWPKPKKVARRVMIETIRFDSFHLW